jgi:hypothetical protein
LTRNPLVLATGAAVASLLAFSCGGSSSPAAPQTVATPTPPPPTPPPPPLSVIPPCVLPASNPGFSADCQQHNSQLQNDVYAAIDRVMAQRPELFNMNDVDGGPRILELDKYMVAVVAALGEAGLCGHVDPEGEIGVKMNNTFSEQWIIASKAGYNPPVGNWVKRKYVGDCRPATF